MGQSFGLSDFPYMTKVSLTDIFIEHPASSCLFFFSIKSAFHRNWNKCNGLMYVNVREGPSLTWKAFFFWPVPSKRRREIQCDKLRECKSGTAEILLLLLNDMKWYKWIPASTTTITTNNNKTTTNIMATSIIWIIIISVVFFFVFFYIWQF